MGLFNIKPSRCQHLSVRNYLEESQKAKIQLMLVTKHTNPLTKTCCINCFSLLHNYRKERYKLWSQNLVEGIGNLKEILNKAYAKKKKKEKRKKSTFVGQFEEIKSSVVLNLLLHFAIAPQAN